MYVEGGEFRRLGDFHSTGLGLGWAGLGYLAEGGKEGEVCR